MTNEPYYLTVPASPAAASAPLTLAPSASMASTDSLTRAQSAVAVLLTVALTYFVLPAVPMLVIAVASGGGFWAGVLAVLLGPTLLTVAISVHRGASGPRTWFRAVVVASLSVAVAAGVVLWAISQIEF